LSGGEEILHKSHKGETKANYFDVARYSSGPVHTLSQVLGYKLATAKRFPAFKNVLDDEIIVD
jgi:hypothetical protein